MSEEESMFGYEPKPKSKPKINLTKWFALGVGGLLGLSYIGMVGMVVNKSKNQLPKLDIPVLDIQLPLPTAEVVATATYAAVAAVATTTLATPFFDQIKKKLQKFIQGKINKWKENHQKKKRKD